MMTSFQLFFYLFLGLVLFIKAYVNVQHSALLYSLKSKPQPPWMGLRALPRVDSFDGIFCLALSDESKALFNDFGNFVVPSTLIVLPLLAIIGLLQAKKRFESSRRQPT